LKDRLEAAVRKTGEQPRSEQDSGRIYLADLAINTGFTDVLRGDVRA
jgi:hypothetical protein